MTAPPKLLLLTAMAMEFAAVRNAGAWHLERTGMGPEKARAAAERTGSIGADAVAVAGFCGSLRPDLRPGDVVVATQVRAPDGTVRECSSGPLMAALRRRGVERVHAGPVASADHVVNGVERSSLAETGAIAVDMESAWLAASARELPLAVLRVVVDTPQRELGRLGATATGGLAAYRALRAAAPALSDWAKAAGPRTILLAGPRSFCAGVERAIEIVDRALERFGPPVYVRKQIVHNGHVVRDLEHRGAIFVDEIDEVPRGATVVYSAHGVSPAVREESAARALKVIDATCPLVTKVHSEAKRFAKAGFRSVLVGHEGHEEVEGTSGEAPAAISLIESADQLERLDLGDDDRVAYLTQTTLAVDEVQGVVAALRGRFPNLVAPGSDDICYATTNRQDAVKSLARECDLLLVIGSGNSSNSKRLVEVAEREGCEAHLMDDETELDPEWLVGADTVAVTAGASAPELLVDRVIEALAGLGPITLEERNVVDENVQFTLPMELR